MDLVAVDFEHTEHRSAALGNKRDFGRPSGRNVELPSAPLAYNFAVKVLKHPGPSLHFSANLTHTARLTNLATGIVRRKVPGGADVLVTP